VLLNEAAHILSDEVGLRSTSARFVARVKAVSPLTSNQQQELGAIPAGAQQ
jgi:hypothetical protein